MCGGNGDAQAGRPWSAHLPQPVQFPPPLVADRLDIFSFVCAEDEVTELLCSRLNSVLKPGGDPGRNLFLIFKGSNKAFAILLETARAKCGHVGDAETCVGRNCYEVRKVLSRPPVAVRILALTVLHSACLKHPFQIIVAEWKPLRSEEHTSELQSLRHLVCRLLLEKNKKHAVCSEHCCGGQKCSFDVARLRACARPGRCGLTTQCRLCWDSFCHHHCLFF